VFCCGEVYALFLDQERIRRDKECNDLCSFHHTDCVFWRVVKDKVRPDNVFDILSEHSGCEVISDSSKTPEWLMPRITRMPGEIAVRPIVLSKTLADYTASAMTRMTGMTVERCVREWEEYYRGVWTDLGLAGLKPLAVLYEKLAREPEATLRTLCGELGLTFTDLMLTPWENENAHPVYGNHSVTFFRKVPSVQPEVNFVRDGMQVVRGYQQNFGKVFYHADKAAKILSDAERQLVQEAIDAGIEKVRFGL